MSVTNEHPTRVGQRVQDIYDDTRGWVVELGEHEGEKVAVVDWDEKPVGDEDAVFPVTSLLVVRVIRIDADHWDDPATHPQVESAHTGTGEPVYLLKTGSILKGRDQMRAWLLGYHKRA